MNAAMIVLVFGVLLSQAGSVDADSSVLPDDILPLPLDPRCHISAGAPVIDYGEKTRWQLLDSLTSQTITLGKRTLMLSVVCPYSQNMLLTLYGDRATNGDLRYGDRGSISFRVHDAQVDGKDVLLSLTSSDGTLDGASVSSLKLQPGKSFAATQDGHVVMGKAFNARIEIEPTMPQSSARVTSRHTTKSDFRLELKD